MAYWRHQGGGRYAPHKPSPGLRAGLAHRDVEERVMAERLRQQREEARARAEAERLGLKGGCAGDDPSTTV